MIGRILPEECSQIPFSQGLQCTPQQRECSGSWHWGVVDCYLLMGAGCLVKDKKVVKFYKREWKALKPNRKKKWWFRRGCLRNAVGRASASTTAQKLVQAMQRKVNLTIAISVCKQLPLFEVSYTRDGALPIQDLTHVKQTCETLSNIHTSAHHPSLRLIHDEQWTNYQN